jgi:cytochrome c peroxidase
LSLIILSMAFVGAELARAKAQSASRYARYRTVLKPLPETAPVPAGNPQGAEKVELGRMLYWDRRVSKTGATSCGFCHHPAYYGAEPMRKSVGVNGDVHLRNAQTVLNAAFLESQFWAGEQPDLEGQALGAVQSHVAMRSWPNEVAERLNRLAEYRELSVQAFGTPVTEEAIGKALAAYMRTLPSGPLVARRRERHDRGAEARHGSLRRQGMRHVPLRPGVLQLEFAKGAAARRGERRGAGADNQE